MMLQYGICALCMHAHPPGHPHVHVCMQSLSLSHTHTHNNTYCFSVATVILKSASVVCYMYIACLVCSCFILPTVLCLIMPMNSSIKLTSFQVMCSTKWKEPYPRSCCKESNGNKYEEYNIWVQTASWAEI
jgi:hypothetical protein